MSRLREIYSLLFRLIVAVVARVARWLERRSLIGELSLIYA